MPYNPVRFTGPPARLPREVERRVDAAHSRGLEAAAKVHAAAYATPVGLTLTASLTAEESRLIEVAPLGEARYKAVVDHFTGVVCTEIARMAW